MTKKKGRQNICDPNFCPPNIYDKSTPLQLTHTPIYTHKHTRRFYKYEYVLPEYFSVERPLASGEWTKRLNSIEDIRSKSNYETTPANL